MAQNNDIVINAAANTKAAEDNIKKLDAQVKVLANNNAKLNAFNDSLKKVEQTTSGLSKSEISTGFAALSGNLNSVITKLGEIGLAVGAVIAVMKTLISLQEAWSTELKKTADAEAALLKNKSDSMRQADDRTRYLLSNIQQLGALAEGGNLDAQGIKTLTALVKEFNSMWNDTNMAVDQVTGKLTGLAKAQQHADWALNNRKKIELESDRQAAFLKKDAALAVYNNLIDENGELTTAGKLKMYSEAGLAASFNAADDPAMYDALKRKFVAEQKAIVENVLKEVSAANIAYMQFERGTQASDVDAALAAGKARQAQRAKAATDAAAAASEADRNAANLLARDNAVAAWNNSFDLKLVSLQNALATAILNGDNAGIEQAKANLNDYQQQQTKLMLQQTQTRYNEALKKLEEAKANNDLAAQSELQKTISELGQQLTQIMAKVKVDPVVAAEEAEDAVEAARKVSYSSSGTFSAYGIDALKQVTIEQEQLKVQKEIAANTKQLAKPVVGE